MPAAASEVYTLQVRWATRFRAFAYLHGKIVMRNN